MWKYPAKYNVSLEVRYNYKTILQILEEPQREQEKSHLENCFQPIMMRMIMRSNINWVLAICQAVCSTLSVHIPFHLHNNPLKFELQLTLILWMRKLRREQDWKPAKFTHLVSGRSKIWIQNCLSPKPSF